jgi:hypothetical protein
MKLTVEFDRETDGRWVADVPELRGPTLSLGLRRMRAKRSALRLSALG